MLWEDVAAKKRASILAQIPRQWILPQEVLDEAKTRRKIAGKFIESLLDVETRSITTLDPVDILAKIRDTQLTAYEVTQAFCKRTAYAHQLNACCLELVFDQALAEAKKLDEYQVNNRCTIGPLHGLPVTLKDQFHIKGAETSMGYVGWLNDFEGRVNTAEESAERACARAESAWSRSSRQNDSGARVDER